MGRIPISGAKNSALPMMAASLLTNEKVVLKNVPSLGDVQIMAEIMRRVGCKIKCKNGMLTLRSNHLEPKRLANDKLATEIRYSTHLIGALLPRFDEVRLPLPGGCNIGTRKLDSHILGFAKLGAKIDVSESFIQASKSELKGSNIMLEYPSVGATENIITAACLAEGDTKLENAAKEPEIVDLANFLNSMGAKISGAETGVIEIKGVDVLGGTDYTIVPDRIETGTYMVAAAVTGGELVLEKTDLSLLKSVIQKLRETDLQVEEVESGVRVTSPDILKPTNIATEVYPGFPTDMQPIITTLLSLADGESIVEENIFDKRFNNVPELVKMGANIKIDGNKSIISGVKKLRGTEVNSIDIRTGGSLVLAALAAQGKTIVCEADQIFRGYEDIVGKLRKVGAELYSTDS